MIDLTLETDFVFDSRKVKKGSIFIALPGNNFDGNDFALKAIEMGAKFLILTKKPVGIPENIFICVPDSLAFITNLAKQKFEKLKLNGVRTISLTGSVGKTTIKDFLYFLIKKAGFKVYASEGNFNNHIGLPISILNAPLDIDFLVLEMGMNHIGEISYLIKIANTDIRIITSITNAHSGNFEEGLFGIAKAKAEILENSSTETQFITISSLPFITKIIKDFKGKLSYANEVADYKVQNKKTIFSFNDKVYSLNKVVTKTWLNNILIGFKVLEGLKLLFPESIEDFLPPEGRGDETQISENCILIDESYNSSPEAVLNSIQTLSLLSGKRLLVLGGMKELGKESFKFHALIFNETLKYPEIETIFVGTEFKEVILSSSKWFKTPEDLIKNYKDDGFNYILAKSSKSSEISKFTKFLKEGKLLLPRF